MSLFLNTPVKEQVYKKCTHNLLFCYRNIKLDFTPSYSFCTALGSVSAKSELASVAKRAVVSVFFQFCNLYVSYHRSGEEIYSQSEDTKKQSVSALADNPITFYSLLCQCKFTYCTNAKICPVDI